MTLKINESRTDVLMQNSTVYMPDVIANRPDIISGSDYYLNNLSKYVSEIEQCLENVKKDQILRDKYPALQEAYDAYLIIKQMVTDAEA